MTHEPSPGGTHPRDEIVPFAAFDDERREFERRCKDAGLVIPSASPFARDAQAAFATLYYGIYASERPELAPADTIVHGAVLAGLGDLAFQLNRAMDKTSFENLRPHLLEMLAGNVRMNAWSSILDASANKTSELYVGALAINAVYDVDLEDPKESAGGQNPDLLLEKGEKKWTIAIKTPQASESPQDVKPRSIWGNIESAVKQIERSNRPGIPLLNLKNVVDRRALEKRSPFRTIGEAKSALKASSGAILDAVRSATDVDDWKRIFSGKFAAPLVAYMTQVTVSAISPDGVTMFVPIRELRLRPYPPRETSELSELAGIDAEIRDMVSDLNEQLQANPVGRLAAAT